MKPINTLNPLFVKSNNQLMQKVSALRPKTVNFRYKSNYCYFKTKGRKADDYEDQLYRIHCEGKTRDQFSKKRRRRLPILSQSQMSIDLDLIQPYNEAMEHNERKFDEVVVEEKDFGTVAVCPPNCNKSERRGPYKPTPSKSSFHDIRLHTLEERTKRGLIDAGFRGNVRVDQDHLEDESTHNPTRMYSPQVKFEDIQQPRR